FDRDPLAETVKRNDAATLDGRERRINRAEQERAGEADALHALADDPGPQRAEGQQDVRELGHEADLGSRPSSHEVCADAMSQVVQLAAELLQTCRVVRLERLGALLPQLAHASLESSLVEARCCVVVRVRVDAEGAADRGNQMLLVHLRIALYGLVF